MPNMFPCVICGKKYHFLRDIPEPTPSTICNKCRQCCLANISGDQQKMRDAAALVPCMICNIAAPRTDNDPACDLCKFELKEGLEPAMQADAHPPPMPALVPASSNHAANNPTAASMALGATSASIFRAGALHQTHASVVGGRLAQTVKYIPPSPLPPNLESAQRVKALTKRGHLNLGLLQPLYPQAHQVITASTTYQIYLAPAVFALPSKPRLVSKLVRLTDIQDGFGCFEETANTLSALYELIDGIRAEYGSVHQETYGPFPLFSDMIFQLETPPLPGARGHGHPLPLQIDWMDGRLSKLVSHLRGSKALRSGCDTLTIHLIWRQQKDVKLDSDFDGDKVGKSSDEDTDANKATTGTKKSQMGGGQGEVAGIDVVSDGSGKESNVAIGNTARVPEFDIVDVTGEDNEGCDEENLNADLKEGGERHSRSKNRGATDGKRRRDVLSEDELLEEQPPARSREPSPLPPYNPFVSVSAPDITYTARYLQFTSICTVQKTGDFKTDQYYATKEIFIANEWINEMREGRSGPDCALLGAGGYKIAIRGSMGGKPMAILICRPPPPQSGETLTENDNFIDLVCEHRGLGLGDYFMKRWYATAQAVGHGFPRMKFNYEDSFIGKLDPQVNPTCGTSILSDDLEGPGKGALPFLHFLAVPLLRVDEHHVQERYIPASGISENETEFQEILNSFVHFTFQASHRRYVFGDLQGVRQPGGGCILFDPQYHIAEEVGANKRRPTWDHGVKAGPRFVTEHECKISCYRLKLREPGSITPKQKVRPRRAIQATANANA